ncbi:MAG: RNA polymerase sigma factor [Acidobacteriota bacterium]
MICQRKHRHSSSRTEEYATREHFLKLFADQLEDLYLFAFLLTANHQKAEQCFVAGLDQCLAGNEVSRAWARSWARRIIVRNAVRMLVPHPLPANAMQGEDDDAALSPQDAPYGAVLALGDFERIVFVLSVLERYSDQDCAALLGTSRHEIVEARLRAVARIANPGQRAAAPSVYAVEPLREQPSA